MTNARDNEGVLLPDAQRLTKFGRLLRSTSLDELPCLLNLLRGDLTLVGPRPFISSYLPLYSSEQSRRHDVVPGITGLAQVNGRNSISWEEKFALDIWYVDNQSVKLDFCIICKTVINVVSRRDISESDHFTMSRFTGKINDPK
jgi:sugar transferase EpsL